jgi:hypothetical protein
MLIMPFETRIGARIVRLQSDEFIANFFAKETMGNLFAAIAPALESLLAGEKEVLVFSADRSFERRLRMHRVLLN